MGTRTQQLNRKQESTNQEKWWLSFEMCFVSIHSIVLSEKKKHVHVAIPWQFKQNYFIQFSSYMLLDNRSNVIQYSLWLSPDSWVMVKISTAGKWFHGIFHSQAVCFWRIQSVSSQNVQERSTEQVIWQTVMLALSNLTTY